MGPVFAAENQLLLRPSQERFSSGDRIWWLEWRQGKQVLQRWAAATGAGQSQGLDRRWSPGNGAPLPAGTYALGADKFVVNQSLVLRKHICGENRHLSQAPKR